VNTFQSIVLIGLLGNAIIGAFVWFSNPKRRLNRYFCLTAGLIALWLLCMLAITFQTSPGPLAFWTRQASAAAGLLPIGFFVLNLVIVEPEIKLGVLGHRIRMHLLAAVSVIILCQTQFFMRRAFFASPLETVPVGVYGPGIYLFIAYFAAMVIGMVVAIRTTFRTTSGVQRTESQFLLLGCALSFSFGLFLFAVSVLGGTQEVTRFLPLFALILDGFVAYGIATRRILSVSEVLQRVTAYALMAIYLGALYSVSAWAAGVAFSFLGAGSHHAAHMLAALVVAFSVVPAHRWMHVFSRRLFPATAMDVDELLSRAGTVFREMSTEANLMANFSKIVAEAFGTTKVLLLRPARVDSFFQAYPEPADGNPVRLDSGSAIVKLLVRDREAFTVDMLQRMRSSPLVEEAQRAMRAAGASLAVGSFMRNEMKALLLLFPKKTGRIYDLRDQRGLKLLCDQLGVALDNANLYTAVQNGKIYNDILLDSLTSGIVAVNTDRVVTVFNLRAQALTGLAETAVVDRPLAELPAPLAASLETILSERVEFRDKDLCIPRGDEAIPIRASGSLFHGHTGQPIGALLVFNDMTLLKKMEEQIRRTDRLSSIGTLSAGMAHEIKNPLVTIKTFAQLLPQQHHDSEFRNSFFELVGQEVNRIDTIVNRLLNFARPARPFLKPTALHKILENSLRLIDPQLFQRGIALDQRLDASRDLIAADAEQLNQTFINFFLNAIQAMDRGGRLTVRTTVIPHSAAAPRLAGLPDGDRIQVDVQDTGSGIAPENMSKIFDPFFTTKDTGVGLGLSVSHGIIQEHGGTIDVESEIGRGAIFHVQFPLLATPGPDPA
jgi:signal transduction histidine kinase